MTTPDPIARPLRSRPAAAARATATALLAVMIASALITAPTRAAPTADAKPYDDRLLRLAEILGAVHYLRELCSAGDGQLWRERMQDLLNSEGNSALRRMKLTRSFNQGYRSYSRTYIACTPSAQSAITRFLAEGAQLSDTLVKSIP